MSHLECPNCNLRISALGAPPRCPRCRIRSGQRVELVPAPVLVARRDRPGGSARSARMQPFGLSVGEGRPGCLKIDIRGELDLAVADQLSQALASAGEHREVLVDLERCDFVDSSGIEAILEAERLLALEGRQIAVIGAKGQVLRILTVAGLTGRGLTFSGAEEDRVDPPKIVAV
jgi:anti-anti-sigma factor